MKTSELTGPALDWAVAKCENPEWSDEDAIVNVTTFDDYDGTICNYSTDWDQGGPIIERERIDVTWSGEHWTAIWWADNSGMVKAPAQRFSHNRHQQGPTPLIAAMRAYVASKLGDEVEIPAELED